MKRMKKINLKVIALLAVAFLMAGAMDVYGQRGRGMVRMGGMEQVCPNIPNLTEEQSKQIMSLRTSHLAEMQGYRDQIDINRAQYRALMRGDRADMAAINANIDERNSIRTRMEKRQAAHLQDIRSILTDEQRVWFDVVPRAGAVRGAGMRQAVPYRGRGAGMQYGPGGRGRGPGIMRNQPGYRSGY